MCEAVETDDGALLGSVCAKGRNPRFVRWSRDIPDGSMRRRSGNCGMRIWPRMRPRRCSCFYANERKKMKPEQKLSGWLFVTLGYTVKSILRSRERRQRHEKVAAMERPTAYSPPPLADDLDVAVARLSESDRMAILLRFYQGLEFALVARRPGSFRRGGEKACHAGGRAVAGALGSLGIDGKSDGSFGVRRPAASAFGARRLRRRSVPMLVTLP